MKWRLAYRQLMLFHNIIQSGDERMAKGVVRQQEGEEGSFHDDAMNWANELGVSDVHEMKKSELKKKIKTAVKTKMETEIRIAMEGRTKLRFVQQVQFRQAPYFERYGSEDVNLILKLRLNMVNIHANYKGDITKKRLCVHCNISRDTTEHLVQCPSVFGCGEGGHILCDPESDEWPWLLKVVRTNLDNR